MTEPLGAMSYESFVNQFPGGDPFKIDTSSFEILSTIRYDPSLTEERPHSVASITKRNFFLLTEHVERLKFTVDYFASKTGMEEVFPFEIEENYIFQLLVKAIDDSQLSTAEPLRIRLLTSMEGKIRVELYETAPRVDLLDGLLDDYPQDQRYDVYVDTTPVLPSPFTSFKTTSRDVYTRARNKALPGSSKREEVILVNSCGEVMEGSITNIAIKSESGEWITPKLTSGCLCGVTRHFLLQKNMIKEDLIQLDRLHVGQDVLMLNGILGVVRGTIRGFVGQDGLN